MLSEIRLNGCADSEKMSHSLFSVLCICKLEVKMQWNILVHSFRRYVLFKLLGKLVDFVCATLFSFLE